MQTSSRLKIKEFLNGKKKSQKKNFQRNLSETRLYDEGKYYLTYN